MKRILRVVALLSSAVVAPGQETLVELDRMGAHTKHLTFNLQDTWKFQGKAGESIVVVVRSRQFDPVIKLENDTGLLVPDVDGKGSESRFMCRLASDGEHRVLVHAFRHSGGGNYDFSIDRFTARPATTGEDVRGQIEKDGRAHIRFLGPVGKLVVPRFLGRELHYDILDPEGRQLPKWEGVVTIEHEGEHVLRVSGGHRTRFQVNLLPSEERRLEGEEHVEKAAPGSVHVWRFPGTRGALRWIEVVGGSTFRSRVIPVRAQASGDGMLYRERVPALRALPVSSKGDRIRHAFVTGYDAPYQLQLLSRSSAAVEYKIRMTDPSRPITTKAPVEEDLPIGSAHFHRLDIPSGQLLRVDLDSDSFDPLLRLARGSGEIIQHNDDGGGKLNSRLDVLIRRGGQHYLQVSSTGDGGGGRYRLHPTFVPIPTLAVGERRSSRLGRGGREVWRFEGKKDQTVFVSAQSRTVDPRIEVLSPGGVTLGKDQDGGVDSDSLLALRLPDDGSYTLIISAQRGAGAYTLRIIDAA